MKKARKITSSLDEPSTSFKEESEESFEKRKRDKRDEGSDNVADVQPRKKKSKLSKIEVETKVKRDVEEEMQNRDVDCYLTGGMDAEGSSESSSAFDPDDEDNVSRHYFY